VSFGEDTRPAAPAAGGLPNLATIRAAIIAALKDAGYLHVLEGRRDHTTPAEGRRDHTTPAETLRLHGLD